MGGYPIHSGIPFYSIEFQSVLTLNSTLFRIE